ncbi:uncharacterized protein LOC143912378 [Arctopsyche grandis]|uniref:uncharacterized protein LOC143912378 n=1 Tax=Arctopsyche grandis TaxID=121162 RepID=UPI00406D6FE9
MPPTPLKINDKNIELVHQYKYLGCWLNDQWDHSQEIKIRIEMARNAFFKMRDLLCNRDFNLDLRMRILHCYVLSVLLYGVESWTMTQATEKKLAAFEMWCFRRMLRIPWVDRVRNEEVLNRMKRKRELLSVVKRRKLRYLGHVMRNPKYEIIQLILQGKVQGKRGVANEKKTHLMDGQSPWMVAFYKTHQIQDATNMILQATERDDTVLLDPLRQLS